MLLVYFAGCRAEYCQRLLWPSDRGSYWFYAIGAVTSAYWRKVWAAFWLSAPLAILVTCFAGLVVGLPSVRLEGAYLALATLGLGESVRIMIAVTPALGSSTGIMMIPAPTIGDYVIRASIITFTW